MKEQLISFETAKLGKEKGFDWEVQTFYDNESKRLKKVRGYEDWNTEDDGLGFKPYSAPTQALLQKWLREEHKINVESNYLPNIQKYRCLYVPMSKSISNKEKYSLRSKYYGTDDFETYEEALEKGLQEALKLIKL